MKTSTLLLIALVALLGACHSNDVTSTIAEPPIAEAPCPEDLMCTEVFIYINVTVVDKTGSPVILDRYSSKNPDTGKEYDFQNEHTGVAGVYTLITDAQLSELRKTGSPIAFIGYKNGQAVVEETYQIGHNCCHVEKLSGADTLQVSLP